MSIKSQANFWLKNVCYFNSTEHNFTDETIAGFHAFSTLLQNIYEDYQSFEISTKGDTFTKIGIAENDLDNYHNLTDTVDCLYKMSVSFVVSMLEKHGFYFVFYKNENEVKEYKQCNTFCLYYDTNNSLIPSMKLLADTLAKQNTKTDL